MIYIIVKDFARFKLEALWDDSVFGIKHWHDFSHIAVVADHAWLRVVVNIFKPFFHGDVRLFSLSELPAAKDWITNAKKSDRMTVVIHNADDGHASGPHCSDVA